MKTFFTDLFEYNRQMNGDLIRAIIQQKDKVSEKTINWMNHILNAHEIINTRIETSVPAVASWDLRDLGELEAINENNFALSMAIVEKFDLSSIIRFTTATGVPLENSIRDMLFHVINHSTYHRGQIAVNFRETGLNPLVSDWVFYRRGR